MRRLSTAPIGELLVLQQQQRQHLAGILGQDILTEFAAIELDFQNLEMRLHKRAGR